MRIGNIVFLLLAALCFANAIELALVREDPAEDQQDAQETEAAEGPTETKSTDKVGQAEADLKSTRSSLHGGVNAALESAAKAADVAVNNNGKNFSDHLDSSKAIGDSLSGKLDELASKRARVSKLREERRKRSWVTWCHRCHWRSRRAKGRCVAKSYLQRPTNGSSREACKCNK